MSGMFTKKAAPVVPLTSSRVLSSLLRFGENAAVPSANATAAATMRGVGEVGRGALDAAWNGAKATGKGAWNYAVKPTGRAVWAASKATGRGVANVVSNPKVRQLASSGLNGALGLAAKAYKAPYTVTSRIAGKLGASPRLAGVIGSGALLGTYLGREAYRNGGSLDLLSPGTYGNMLINPARDAWNFTSGGLNRLFSGAEEDTAGLASKSEVGATDADIQRAAHAAQNAGVTATPNISA